MESYMTNLNELLKDRKLLGGESFELLLGGE
jgi:hypothetical protein